MRASIVLLALLATSGFATDASAAAKIRLAQSSSLTNCMVACNSQYASCQSSCVSNGAVSTFSNSGVGAGNIVAGGSCTSACTNVQLSCQTSCARIPPSQ
jgi:hypothetical protein